MNFKTLIHIAFIFLSGYQIASGQEFDRQDTLRGSITKERLWWDLTYYDLAIDFDIAGKSLRGTNTVYFNLIEPHQIMQIDLQEPLRITGIDFKGVQLPFRREGNVYWINFPSPLIKGTSERITIAYEGTPVEAEMPPWDGGLTWAMDANRDPFVATSCQGLGSSVWWPCKDHMYDEPDSMLIRITTPAALMDVSNGRLRHIEYHPDAKKNMALVRIKPDQ